MVPTLLIRTDLRIIDRQEKKDSTNHRVVELYHDPTGRKVRFEATIKHQSPMYSTASVAVWDGCQWQRLHSLLDAGTDPVVAITLMFATVGELLDWPVLGEAT